MPSHLSAAEQKQVQTVIDRARGDSTVPHSAQDSIPFQRMFPDGICRVTDNYYTKTIQFQDINYQLAQQEVRRAGGQAAPAGAEMSGGGPEGPPIFY